MKIANVLAVVSVSDIAIAREWYVRLIGREPDNNPMDSLIEWQLVDHGWVQVTSGSGQPGTAMLNLAVDDLADAIGEITDRGIATAETQSANKGVEICPIQDPDGNVITLIGNFRVQY